MGNRAFYWDTVFCPDGFGDKTYAQMVDEGGLESKLPASQSMKALKVFMQHRLDNAPSLFPGL
jgi:inosine/xanthosine triphosphate pyrophosphatase family protein